MTFSKIDLALRIGPGTPGPAPGYMMTALRNVEVTQQDSVPCGFQLTFLAELSSAQGDFAIVDDPLLAPFNRVLVRIAVDGAPTTLIDGFITHHQYMPGNGPADATFVVTGEDVSVKMAMVDWSREFLSLPDSLTAAEVLAPWAFLGIRPQVVAAINTIVPVDYVPQQAETDRAMLQRLAQQNGHVFYVTPADEPFVNIAYWGPPQRTGAPSALLDVAVGAASNTDSFSGQLDAMAPVTYFGLSTETLVEPYIPLPVLTSRGMRVPPLAARPVLSPANLLSLRVRHELWREDQLDPVRANIKAQALTDASTDAVVQVSCEASVVRLGTVVFAPGIVGVRGTGEAYDGLYYLKSATHKISLLEGQQWDYTQQLSMTREGVGTTAATLEVA